MIEFAPTLGEDALIGRAPVRSRGRSSSSSINHHSISSKQQRSSSITNSPDPSIITSDAVEPTAAGSRGAPATRRQPSVPRRPFRGTRHGARGYRSAQRQETNQSHRSSIIISKSKQRHWRTRSILPSLSPRIFLHLTVHSATVAIVRAVHRGPPLERSGEGGSSLHGPIPVMHRTQRAPFDEKHAHQRRP